MKEACTSPWLAYKAGETFPDAAVVEGRLADGSSTYVANVTHRDRQAFAYYNHKSEFA